MANDPVRLPEITNVNGYWIKDEAGRVFAEEAKEAAEAAASDATEAKAKAEAANETAGAASEAAAANAAALAELAEKVTEDEETISLNTEDIEEISTDIETIRNLAGIKRKYIFIGDSYGAGYGLSNTSHNWIDYAINLLKKAAGYENLTFKKSAVSGAGFTAGTTFKQQLDNITVANDPTNLDVTDIIVCGGWNDGEASVNSAVAEFQAYAKTHYPYAKIHIGYIAWESSVITGGAKVPRAVGLTNYIHAAQENACIYMSNIQYVLHDYSLFLSDGIHPNDDGNFKIAAAVVNHLLGGGINAIDGYREFNPIFPANVTPDRADGGYFTFRHDNTAGLWFNATAWTFDEAIDFSSHPADDQNGVGWYKLFDLPAGQLVEGNNANGSSKIALPAAFTSGDTVTTAMAWLWLRNDNGKTGVWISPYVVGGYATESGTGYRPITGVTHIMFNVSVIDFKLQSLYT